MSNLFMILLSELALLLTLCEKGRMEIYTIGVYPNNI
jgi:hypothetical protein